MADLVAHLNDALKALSDAIHEKEADATSNKGCFNEVRQGEGAGWGMTPG